jgi:protocatechuate 3,4-dioxygenase beta subunit
MDRAKLCLLLCVACVNIVAQPAGRGVISGTVVEASSGDAVRKAVVTATWHGTPRAWATTRTDGSGRFTIEGLPAGQYDLRAVKQGLGTAIYGANSVRELGDVITLGDAEVHGDVKLRFLRSGIISGRVVDPDGEPVANAMVSLLRPGRNLGERVLTNAQGVNTNDRGEYKITGVDPGEYYLRCMPNMQGFPGVQGPHEIVVPQYYGGARDSKDAAPLNLRGGDSLSGIDFRLSAEHPATITGRVSGVPQLDSPAEPQVEAGFSMRNGRRFHGGGGQAVMIELMPAENNQMGWGGGGAGAQGPDYRFEMPAIVPGRYRIQANIRAKDKSYYASQLIDVHEGTNDFVLAMVPAVAVKGHLKVEGPGSHPVEGFTINLAAPGSGQRGGNYSSSVKKDGSFTIEDVPPGEWLLNINPNPGGLFDKSVRLGDKDFLFQRLDIPPGLDVPLNIVLSSNTAVVSGEVDAAGADLKRAGILLAPVGKLHTLARFYYAALSDDNGKFKLNTVAPGKYKIFALEKIATASYRNPESADLLDGLGEEVEVTEGAKIELHPKLIPEEKAKEILKP